MKKTNSYLATIILVIALIFTLTNCKKTDNPIKFKRGTFPDSLINMTGINSAYDDYNMALPQLTGHMPIIFSSNRGSNGGQFDLVQGSVNYNFVQTNGDFFLDEEMTNDPFLNKLISAGNTPGNDFGPYRIYSAVNGMEYMILSSVNQNGNLDFYFTKNLPVFGASVPDVNGPFPATLLNSGSEDAYFCFDTNQDSAYFCSNPDGNFDIFLQKKPADTTIETWLDLKYAISSKVDILNSTSDDKCPFIHRKLLVFASNRDGGLGGFDLYYSVFKNGHWNAPVNFGAPINSASDEYRPVCGSDQDFTNMFIMFSSNRPGGLGGFDLYFTGINNSILN